MISWGVGFYSRVGFKWRRYGILRQTSVKMAVLLHKQAKVPFIMIIAV